MKVRHAKCKVMSKKSKNSWYNIETGYDNFEPLYILTISDMIILGHCNMWLALYRLAGEAFHGSIQVRTHGADPMYHRPPLR